jgi:hypothetical protein
MPFRAFALDPGRGPNLAFPAERNKVAAFRAVRGSKNLSDSRTFLGNLVTITLMHHRIRLLPTLAGRRFLGLSELVILEFLRGLDELRVTLTLD